MQSPDIQYIAAYEHPGDGRSPYGIAKTRNFISALSERAYFQWYDCCGAGLVLQDVLLALIRPSQASSLMGQLTAAAPLKVLSHLKRLRKVAEPADGQPALEIILCTLPQAHTANGTGYLHAADGPSPPAEPAFTAWTAERLAAAGAPDAVVQLVDTHKLAVRQAQVLACMPMRRTASCRMLFH